MSLRGKQITPLIRQGWMRAVLLFAAYLAASLLTSVVLGWYSEKTTAAGAENGLNALDIWIVLVALLSAALVWVFRTYIDRRSWKTIGLRLSAWYPGGVIGLLGGTGITCLAGWLMYATGTLEWTGSGLGAGLGWSGLLLLLVAFSEELVFRGYILRNLMKSFHPGVSLVISAGLFTLVHTGNPGIPWIGLVNILLGGLLLGLTFIRTRNLWVAVSFHFAWDFIQGPVLGLPVSGLPFHAALTASLSGSDWLTGGHFGLEGSVWCTLLLVVFLGLLLGRGARGKFRQAVNRL